MEKFIVSARKYRPQTFDTVVGQSHITTTLRNAIRNEQLAHAFLFCGPRGVGKTTCARILAKTINCENKTKDGEACNTCHSCTSFNEGTSLNIHELDAASNNSVDDIRTLVEQVRFAPQSGTYKVYIIDEVHMLSQAAFNAFLKTLEEPPPYAIFILATTEKHKILPTILSRCQIFDFKRITNNDIIEHLEQICGKENVQADKSALQVIAQKSEGCMRDALSIMDKIVSFTNGKLSYANTLEHLNILDADYFFQLLERMQKQDLSGALLLYNDINQKGFEGDMFLNGFAEFLRNVLVSKDEKVVALLEAVEGFRERYRQAASAISAAWLLSALNIINESEIQYRMARNKRLHVEMTLIKLSYLTQAIDLAVTDGLEVKKKLKAHTKALSFRSITPIAVAQPTGEKSKERQGSPASSAEPGIRSIDEPTPAKQLDKTSEGPTTTPRLTKLQQIREQFAQPNPATGEKGSIALTAEGLQEQWMAYTKMLKAARNPAAQSFENALLTVHSDAVFEVTTPNNLELKFIEQERNPLSDFLQKAFNNKQLHYTLRTDERAADARQTEFEPNAKEKYQQISQAYPLVKMLKEKLKLDLDY